jgi:pyruvate/2-oxoglutarate dehydrogenase complex dihydrolipoamide dehydrogenase (E3) component
MVEQVDVIVIGAGQAGPPLAVRMARSGRSVVLVERERLGGTCVNNGCIPTKTLVASARVAHLARRAADFGVVIGEPKVDFARVMARKNAVVQQSRDSLAQWIGGTAGLELIIGEARFVGARTVAVGDRSIAARLVIINTGGEPVEPEWARSSGAPYLTNRSMMDLDRLPEHLVVVGGSYIGLEFAQMFRRFGSRVTVVEYADRLIAREDAKVSAAVRDHLASEGIDIHLGARDFAAEPDGRGARLSFSAGGLPRSLDAGDLLLAVGRTPNVAHLDLARAGVELDGRGFIAIDDQLRTTAEGVYALGDVNGHGAFTHTSYNDYEILAADLLDGDTRRVSDRLAAYALFIDPPLARVGLSDFAAAASGRPVLKAHLPMTRVGRARERGETTGFMEALVDAETQKILGATLFCIEADEIIHSFIQMMAAGVPYTSMARAVPIHPTVSELIPTLLDGLAPLTAPG